MNKPSEDTQTAETQSEELDAGALEQVSGGLLLPAVQKVREAAASTSSSEGRPMESLSLNFTKITY